MASAAGSRSKRPTDAPEQVNKLADQVAEPYRDRRRRSSASPATGCGDHLIARSAWGQDKPGILVLAHLDTVHPIGMIERLTFRAKATASSGPASTT